MLNNQNKRISDNNKRLFGNGIQTKYHRLWTICRSFVEYSRSWTVLFALKSISIVKYYVFWNCNFSCLFLESINRIIDNTLSISIINIENVIQKLCNQRSMFYLLKIDHCLGSWLVLRASSTLSDIIRKKRNFVTKIASTSKQIQTQDSFSMIFKTPLPSFVVTFFPSIVLFRATAYGVCAVNLIKCIRLTILWFTWYVATNVDVLIQVVDVFSFSYNYIYVL